LAREIFIDINLCKIW